MCKFTKVSLFTVDNTKNEILDLGFLPTDFTEFSSLAKNFEFVKYLKVKVTVMPLQNVSNSSTSIMPAYAMTPWHYNIALPKDFNAYLSMDKAKIRRGTQIGYQSYVPSIMLSSGINPNDPKAAYLSTVRWRPEIRTTTETGEAFPFIRTGIAAFQGSSDILNKTSAYNIKWDVFVKFSGQSIMHV